MYTSLFINTNRKFKVKSKSFEFGRRLNLPALDFTDNYFRIKYLNDNAQIDFVVLNYGCLEELTNCPDFRIEGKNILSPITLAKDNKGKLHAVVIGSQEYDIIDRKIGEKESCSAPLKKGAQYFLKLSSNNTNLSNIKLALSGMSVYNLIHNPNNEEEQKIGNEFTKESEKDLYGLYLGSFQTLLTIMRCSMMSYGKILNLSKDDHGNKVMVFYLPDYDNFLIVPVGTRKFINIKNSSSYKKISSDLSSVRRIDEYVFNDILPIKLHVENFVKHYTGSWHTEYTHFLTKEWRDKFFSELSPFDRKRLSEINTMKN